MPTLAQRFTNNRNISIENIKVHLDLLDHLIPKPSTTITEAQQIAEKFLFHHDPAKRVRDHITSKLITQDQVLNTTRPVALPMWIEWTDETPGPQQGAIRFGTLIKAEPKTPHLHFTICCGCADPNDFSGIMALIAMPHMPLNISQRTEMYMLYHSTQMLKGSTKEKIVHVRSVLLDTFYAMFALCTPRVADTSLHIPSRPVRRRQLREHPDKPLIEFKSVHMRIGESAPRGPVTYDPTGDHEAIHRRLHKVIGHYRIYTKDREYPLTTYIDEHWRGDAALGIVLHNREVEEPTPTP